MAVREKGGKWYVVKKNGSLGKRGFSKRSSAEAAQARGRSMAASSPLATPSAADVPKVGVGFTFSSFPGYRTGAEKAGTVHSWRAFDSEGRAKGKKKTPEGGA